MKPGSCGVRNPGCALYQSKLLTDVRNADRSYVPSLCETSTYGCCPFGVVPRLDSTGTNCSMPGAALDPAPTMYLGATENNLYYQLAIPDPKSGGQILYTLGVTNVPIQRWVHSVLCVYDRTAEIYIDGKLARTTVMPNVMADISTNGDIYLSPAEPGDTISNVGFSGYTSQLTYYPNPITPQDVWNLYKRGPGTSSISGGGNPDYNVQVSLYDGNIEKSSYTISGSGLTGSHGTSNYRKY
jgi:hypothetical protein